MVQVAKNIVFVAQAYLAAPAGTLEEEEEPEEPEEAPKKAEKAVPLGWLMRRLSYLGRTSGLVKRRCVFQCLAALCVKLDQDVIAANLPRIISPLFRITTRRYIWCALLFYK